MVDREGNVSPGCDAALREMCGLKGLPFECQLAWKSEEGRLDNALRATGSPKPGCDYASSAELSQSYGAAVRKLCRRSRLISRRR